MPHSFGWDLITPVPPASPGGPGDHRFDTLARLAQYLRGKNKVEALLLVAADAIDAADVAIAALGPQKSLDTATGAFLDLIGRIIGRRRAGATDDVYRQYLRAQVKADRSSGTIAEILEILGLVLAGTGAKIHLTEYQPAAIVVRVEQQSLGVSPEANLSIVTSLLRAIRAAGIGCVLEYEPTGQTEAETFGFFDSDGLGFGDTANAATGGKLSSAVAV